MPDLGKYAFDVLVAYAGSLVMLAGLIWVSLHRSRKVKRALSEVERNG